MQKLDIFNHIFPKPYYDLMMKIAPGLEDMGKRVRGVPMLYDLDERFRVMDRFDDYQQVLRSRRLQSKRLANPRLLESSPRRRMTVWRSSSANTRIGFRDSWPRSR